MRIGIDCRTILSMETGELAGTAHYTSALVHHLLAIDKENTYVLFFDGRIKTAGHPSPGDGFRLPVMDWANKNVEMVFLPVSRLPFVTTYWFLARALRRAKLDLFHSPAHPLPLGYNGKSVWTVHDLAIYNHPEWFPGGARQWFSTRVTVPRSISRVTRLIAVSENTKRDMMRIFNVPKEKISVIYEGAPKINQNDNTKFKNYFLFIGTIEPRKNLVRLIDAFIQFRQNNLQLTLHHPSRISGGTGQATYNLLLAGASGWKNDEVFLSIERANLKLGKGSVQYLGYVSEEEKMALLKNATAFVWPSLYEGFGLPVLEAMSVGVPVITSNVSSIPEITGDAAVLVDPESVEEIADAMKRIVEDRALREQLKTRGVARAKEFTWEKMAKETLAVYQEVL